MLAISLRTNKFSEYSELSATMSLEHSPVRVRVTNLRDTNSKYISILTMALKTGMIYSSMTLNEQKLTSNKYKYCRPQSL